MNWLHDLSYLFGGAFLANAVPHFVSGTLALNLSEPVRQAARRRSFLFDREMRSGDLRTSCSPIFSSSVSAPSMSHRADHVIAAGVGVLLIGVMSARTVRAFPRRQFAHWSHDGMSQGHVLARCAFTISWLWAGASFVSNVGSWMQRTAQDWLVLTERLPTTMRRRSASSWRCNSRRRFCFCL